MDYAHFHNKLERYLRDKVYYLNDLSVSNVMSINNGWECDIYSFDLGFLARGEHQSKAMILRMYTGKEIPPLGPKHLREFNTLRQLSCDGYPVPEVYLLECDPTYLGSPFIVMEKIEGSRLDSIYTEANPDKREELFAQMCQLFVDLHNLDWRGYEDSQLKESDAVQVEIERHRQLAVWAGAQYALPALTWLEKQADKVSSSRLALAHWDYHSSNIMRSADGSSYVIDWAGAYVTDYRFDLAWSTLFLGDLAPKFVELYGQLAGRPVEDFEFFLGFALFRRILSMVISIDKGAEMLGMKPGAEEVIRKHKKGLEMLYSKWVSMSNVRVEHVERVIAGM